MVSGYPRVMNPCYKLIQGCPERKSVPNSNTASGTGATDNTIVIKEKLLLEPVCVQGVDYFIGIDGLAKATVVACQCAPEVMGFHVHVIA